MDEIVIKINKEGSFDVIKGDRYADRVYYEEMLGLVSALTMPKERPCLCWMRTKEQHDAMRAKFKALKETDVEFE